MKRQTDPAAAFTRLRSANPLPSRSVADLEQGAPPLAAFLRTSSAAPSAARRAGRGRLPLHSTRRVAAFVLAVAAAALLIVPPFGLAERLLNVFDGRPVPSEQLSPEQLHIIGAMAAATSPRVDASARVDLDRVGASNLRVIATRQDRSFYVADRVGGGLCVTSGPANDPQALMSFACAPDFPSADQPLLDESSFGGSLDAPTVRRFTGFADDSVASVGLRLVGGEVAGTTPVEDNVYLASASLPEQPVSEILAFDKRGDIIYSVCVKRGGCSS
jgi:hypothetical protein